MIPDKDTCIAALTATAIVVLGLAVVGLWDLLAHVWG